MPALQNFSEPWQSSNFISTHVKLMMPYQCWFLSKSFHQNSKFPRWEKKMYEFPGNWMDLFLKRTFCWIIMYSSHKNNERAMHNSCTMHIVIIMHGFIIVFLLDYIIIQQGGLFEKRSITALARDLQSFVKQFVFRFP